MRVYVVKTNHFIYVRIGIAFMIFICAVLALTNIPWNATNVFSENRELPIYSVKQSEKVVSVTFDNAWGAGDIPDIINSLEKENVKATFFMVGQWAEKYPEVVKLISENGHDIANHSYSHLKMGSIDMKRMKYEIAECGKKLNEITGKEVELFRAPYGDYNDSVINAAKELGYYTIQWDVDSLDWKPDISREEILNRVLKKVRPGSIILFHNDTPHTAKLLPQIIQAIKKEGYRFVPVSELILRENFIIDFEGRQREKE